MTGDKPERNKLNGSNDIRVTCYGKATIVEVAYQEKAISQKGETEDELKLKATEAEKTESSIKDLTTQKLKLVERIKLAENEKDLLEKYRVCISSDKKDKVVDVLEKKNVENLLGFLSIYNDRREKLTESVFSLNEKLEATNKEIDVLKFNLEKLKPQALKRKTGRHASILLDVKEKGSVLLVVSYVVSNASWTPLYDVRAFHKDSSVQVLYFANIKQNTGEDWEDAKLSLSTAVPSVGGSPPELQPQVLQIKQPDPVKIKRQKKKRHRSAAPSWALRERDQVQYDDYDPTIEDSDSLILGIIPGRLCHTMYGTISSRSNGC
ncbi:protein F37C4.5-like [Hydractinia symbiolongicarpus]|uniref:protein F37C4.5-like n=1 Tax=Hydractinia symbiolongicarpus TaxID=13093 RepID=UPI00254EDBD5|nr:protein F37C4.5-like [Hydractinia symbiolongicarpus]